MNKHNESSFASQRLKKDFECAGCTEYEAQQNRLIDALLFYAALRNYKIGEDYNIHQDNGQYARDVLKEIE